MIHPNDSAFGYGVAGDAKAGWHPESIPGLSKREYLAGLAMQGLWASLTDPFYDNYSKLASMAVKTADALIAELNKTDDTNP